MTGWCICIVAIILLEAIDIPAALARSPEHVDGSCTKRFVRLRIRHKNCIPVKVNTRACKGTCSSYTTVSPTEPRKMESRCYCCQYIGKRRRRFGIKCPYKARKGGFKIVIVSIVQPRGCTCRPCSDIPNKIEAAETSIFSASPIADLGVMLESNTFKRDTYFNMTHEQLEDYL